MIVSLQPLKHVLRLLEWIGTLFVYLFVQMSILPETYASHTLPPDYGEWEILRAKL